eukprot:m.101305 g.101305  ORF g.101305 m.101305 type:complete len:350 (-) comp8784_c0_seq5:132-1181(-)
MAAILVTGFQPFGRHVVNPSWQIMQTLDGTTIAGATVVARELPVEYDKIPGLLDGLWKWPGVVLCVHCGVGLEGSIRIERYAHNGTYTRLDNLQAAPQSGKCVDALGADLTLTSSVNVQKLVAELPEADQIRVSEDAGHYLCEFTYFYSLHLHIAPTIFVHVPPLDNAAGNTLESLRARVVRIIDTAMRVIADKKPGLLRPQVGVGAVVTSRAHPGCILVGRRLQDGGHYALPGGHLEIGESLEACARRETKEECGLTLGRVYPGPTLNVVGSTPSAPAYHYVVLFTQAETDGEPTALEPEKCDAWEWHPWVSLPQPRFVTLERLIESGFAPSFGTEPHAQINNVDVKL